MTQLTEPYTHIQKAAAWVVHAVTASGVVLGLMALLALVDNNPKACLLWLGAALLVDGVDGTLARKFSVKTVSAELRRGDARPCHRLSDIRLYTRNIHLQVYSAAGASEMVAVAVYSAVGSLLFCNVNMKSKDNYFVGFPAVWNVVALLLLSCWTWNRKSHSR